MTTTTIDFAAAGHPQMRVAFYGRTARAQTADQTNGDLAGQYLSCVHALPATAQVTAGFYDLGPANWLHPTHPGTSPSTTRPCGATEGSATCSPRRSRGHAGSTASLW